MLGSFYSMIGSSFSGGSSKFFNKIAKNRLSIIRLPIMKIGTKKPMEIHPRHLT